MSLRNWRVFKACASENGSITIEAVLWFPLFIVFMAFIADVSLILHGQAQAQRIAQDANRGLSTGLYRTTDQVEAAIEARLANLASTATASTETSDGVVRTLVTMRSSDFISIGLVSAITNVNMSFAAFHVLETTQTNT